MKCFADITEPEDVNNSIFSNDHEDEEEFQANGYFHCDAAQYEELPFPRSNALYVLMDGVCICVCLYVSMKVG